MRRRPIVAVDLGGTNIRIGMVNSKGEISKRKRFKMPSVSTREQVYESLAALISSFIKTCGSGPRPAVASVGFAGFTDADEGVVYFAPNVSGLTNLEIGPRLGELLGMKVHVENDAKCAALGEFWRGAGRGAGSLFMFTVGTGIGGAFVVDGCVWEGSNGIAGEIGHHIIAVNGPRCACGNKGCLEAIASATAMVKGYLRLAGPGSKDKGVSITARTVVQRARRGEPAARSVMLRAADALGVGIANAFNILNPEVIIIGGGVSRAGSLFVGPAVERARQLVHPQFRRLLNVRRASLGDDAGLIGAAYAAYNLR